MRKDRLPPAQAAEEIRQQKISACKAFFLSGSVVRGEATPHSGLNLVVIYASLEAAWRESFLYKDWPVEAFVHDPATFKYFLKMDGQAAKPFLAGMVAKGIPLPVASDYSRALQNSCQKHLDDGPAELSENEITRRRYGISDLIDDLRAPRSHAEAMASGARLLEDLSDFYLRRQRLWTTDGKSIFRRLEDRCYEKSADSCAEATSQLMHAGAARPPTTPATPPNTFFDDSCDPAAICMKPIIMVGPPQAIPRICMPLATILSKASKLARLLTLTVAPVLTPATAPASVACVAMVPLLVLNKTLATLTLP